MDPGDYALRAAYNAKLTLLAGFTTVRNLGDSFNSTIALRKAIAKGWAVGPRIFTAGGAIGTTGGHADRTDGNSDEVMDNPGVDFLHRHQRSRRGPPRRAAALQGRGRPDQDHGLGRRAQR